MKKFFPDRNHISILTHVLTLISFFALFFLLSSSPALAGCTKVSSNTCSGTQSEVCRIAKPPAGNVDRYCCDTSDDCEIQKKETVEAAKAIYTRPTTDPTDGCPNSSADNPQIFTGLGCISTSTKGFTSALLTFLAGLAGAISLVLMLVATIQIMTGGDNAEQVKKGKELFTGAITGLLFIIFSVTLLQIVAGGIIQLPGFTNTATGGGR